MVMPAVSRVYQLSKYAFPLLLLTWYVVFVVDPGSAFRTEWRELQDRKMVFTDDLLEHDIDGPFNGSGIAELCASKKWHRNLVVSCDPPVGGLGRVKNCHLNCLRFAVEMGASVVLPGIIKRSTEDIRELIPGNPKGKPKATRLDYFWDYEYLNHTLSTYCPQMRLYRSMDDLWDVPSVSKSFGLSLDEMDVAMVNETAIHDMSKFRGQLQGYVESLSPARSRKGLVRFNMAPTYFAWHTASDGPLLAENWGRMLRVREDARRLAASALFKMQRQFKLKIDPRHGIDRESFAGVHLRTEADTADKYATYEEQAANCLYFVAESGSRVVFLATGAHDKHVKAFTERARDFNMTVVVKTHLLEGAELEKLEKQFSYDQRALVDYEMMLRAGLLAGPSQSSFAWTLALRRARGYGQKGNSTPSWWMSKDVQWYDGYSVLFGKFREGKAVNAMPVTIWA